MSDDPTQETTDPYDPERMARAIRLTLYHLSNSFRYRGRDNNNVISTINWLDAEAKHLEALAALDGEARRPMTAAERDQCLRTSSAEAKD